jgi:hypothetical protein
MGTTHKPPQMFDIAASAYGLKHYNATFVMPTRIFHCISARSDKMNQLLNKVYSKGGHEQVKKLRREPHDLSTSCWLHGEGFCLSM